RDVWPQPQGRLPLLLLLLLLLGGDVGDVRDQAVGWARRDLAEDRQVDVAELLAQRRDSLARNDVGDDFGFQRLLRDAAVDPLVRRHVVVMAAVSAHDLGAVHPPGWRRGVGDPRPPRPGVTR